jgi:HlyD family secretion protein
MQNTTTVGMDRKIKKKTWTAKKLALIGAGVLLLAFIFYTLIFADNRSKLNVSTNKITIATVAEGDFQEFIPRTGTVQPIKSFFLDAVEGGIITSIKKETGAMVQPGDEILTLANSNLQLDVLNREAQLYEQINNLRNSRLLLEQNSLRLKADLAEIDYQLQLLKPQYERFQILYDKKMISRREFEEVKEQFNYNVKRKALTYASFRQDSIQKIMQLRQLNDSEARMWKSLDAVNNILDNLVIKATLPGQLASANLEIGQSINIGQRIGQIDVLDSFKIRVRIDELYLPRVQIGQTGSFDFMNNKYQLKIVKIYPTISDGLFEVDMEFEGEEPRGIKRGQSLQIRLELGNPGTALLLPVGGFYQQTGGNWIYVLNEDESKATKRQIRLGRKNPRFYEVLEGLEPGEKVITSGYDNFGNNEVLVLK